MREREEGDLRIIVISIIIFIVYECVFICVCSNDMMIHLDSLK